MNCPVSPSRPPSRQGHCLCCNAPCPAASTHTHTPQPSHPKKAPGVHTRACTHKRRHTRACTHTLMCTHTRSHAPACTQQSGGGACSAHAACTSSCPWHLWVVQHTQTRVHAHTPPQPCRSRWPWPGQHCYAATATCRCHTQHLPTRLHGDAAKRTPSAAHAHPQTTRAHPCARTGRCARAQRPRRKRLCLPAAFSLH